MGPLMQVLDQMRTIKIIGVRTHNELGAEIIYRIRRSVVRIALGAAIISIG